MVHNKESYKQIGKNFIREWAAKALSIPSELLKDEDDLLELGLDSIQLLYLIDECQKHNIKLEFSELFEDTTLMAWEKYWQKVLNENDCELNKKNIEVFPSTTSARYIIGETFTLTPLQQAYWKGRQKGQILGGVACQVYLEIDYPTISDNSLQIAVEKLFARHPMLRMRINEYNQGIILKSVIVAVVQYHWEELTEEASEKEKILLRAYLSSHVADFQNENGFRVVASHYKSTTCLHINIDMVIADAMSVMILLEDLNYYLFHSTELPKLNYLFPQYLLDQKERHAEQVAKSEHYWRKRLQEEDLPLAPLLPLSRQPNDIGIPSFSHREWKLEAQLWLKLQAIARRYGLTPSMLLAGCFAETLRGWSESSVFSLNLTLFNRRGDHPELNKVVADFTSLLILKCQPSESNNLIDNFLILNRQFMKDLDHSYYSAVEVIRDWSQQCGKQIILPIVFTSNLGGKILGEKIPGKLTYIISQTPQVYLDCQIMESRGDLIVSWDSVDELFPLDMLEQMFYFLQTLILSICENEQLLNTPITQYVNDKKLNQRRYPKTNKEPMVFKQRMLHQGFWEQVKRHPNNIAIIDAYRSLSYQNLAIEVSKLSSLLNNNAHFKVANHVGIYLPKGAEQIIAALAILSSGGVYIPLDINQPDERIKHLIRQADISLVISDKSLSLNCPTVNFKEIDQQITAEDIDPFYFSSPENTAYIIFTSGSTGTPKAVEVSHKTVMNTIDDINRRYSRANNMCLLSVSAFNFDLSVYDIFGPLSIGGTIVYHKPGDEKNAQQWLELSHRYQITHWNSVPAIFEMLLIAAEYDERHLPLSLQQIFLSGDWVGLDLFYRLKKLGNKANLVALGGATEASIWSNAFEVSDIVSTWHSIPYGYPLSNQYYRVVDEQYRDCPDWVVGELWIGGKGLAIGYYKDIQKTLEQFVTIQGERFYRTGDYGRFWSNGCLEFLGRKDRQIKLHGHRIELGEIEYVAESIQNIKKAVVIYLENPSKKLHLFIEPQKPKLVSCGKNEYPISEAVVTLSDTPQEEEEITSFLLYQLITNNLQLKWKGFLKGKELQQKANVKDDYELLFSAWLDFLVGQGKLISKEGEYCLVEKHLTDPVITNQYLQSLFLQLRSQLPWIAQVVTGKINKLQIMDNLRFSPEALIALMPSTQKVLEILSQKVNQLAKKLHRPVNLIEFGGRSGLLASQILSRISPDLVCYCLQESALSIASQAKSRLEGYAHNVHVINSLKDIPFKADILFANNALHRCNDINQAILQLHTLCHRNTKLMLHENHRLNSLSMLSVLLLIDSNGYVDFRGKTLSPLLTIKEWEELLPQHGFIPEQKTLLGSYSLFLVCKTGGDIPSMLNQEDFKKNLKQKLPDYMIPSTITVLDKIPLTENGKIDRKTLHQLALNINKDSIQLTPSHKITMTEKESRLAKLWEQILNVEVKYDSNFFLCGGDSLHATRLVELLKKEGAKGVSLSSIFSFPVLKDFADSISFTDNTSGFKEITYNHTDRFLPFPPTDVQQSYLVGRQLNFYLGGVGTYFYQEFEGEPFDVEKLEIALNLLVERHDALRIIFNEDGNQRVLPVAPTSPLEIIHCQEQDWLLETKKQRDRLSHYKVDPVSWPLFKATLIQSSEGKNRFCLGLDNLVLDGLSMRIFVKELSLLYRDLMTKLPPLKISFRDYVISQQKDSKQQAYKYWRNRITELPEAPILPVAIDPLTIEKPYFTRQQSKLSREEWQELKDKAQYYQITPSCLLLTCYSQVLARWSEHSSLTINVTLFNRNPVHPDIDYILGDFTSLLLLETHQKKEENWNIKATRLQQQLWRDLEHVGVSAVWVIREFNRQRKQNNIRMPIVFTSALGMREADYSPTNFPKVVWGISQTPQIWLDHQVFELNGELHFNWDSVKDLFPKGMIKDMFNTYCNLLKKLVKTKSWQQIIEVGLPKTQRISREKINNTEQCIPYSPMHLRIARVIEAHPQQIAIYDRDKAYSYKELGESIKLLAQYLYEQGINENKRIGVALPCSYRQVVAMLAIQWIGAAYVPISVDWSFEQRKEIIKQLGVNLIIDDLILTWPHGVDHCASDTKPLSLNRPEPKFVEENHLAYLLFMTEKQKSVAITHGAAVNTIEAINVKYNISLYDRIITLSTYYCHPYVWDVFGTLSAGATLVMADQNVQQNISGYFELIKKYQVTILNSAPLLLEKLLKLNENVDKVTFPQLRLLIVSNDKITSNLIVVLKKYFPNALCMLMGESDEVAIWSSYCPTNNLAKEFSYAPYGLPLPNQYFRIVNNMGQDCPNWVLGELWIGGKSLAQENDTDKKTKKFIWFQEKHWYPTKNIGRYLPNSRIELIYSKDNQVKILSNYIKFEEIQKTLCDYALVKDAKVFIKQPEQLLAAILITEVEPEWQKVQKFLQKRLPEYAIPSYFGYCSEWPTTFSYDSTSLNSFLNNIKNRSLSQDNSNTKILCEQLHLLLNIDVVYPHDNFFAIGGDSITATKLVSTLRHNYGIELPLWRIFREQIIINISTFMKKINQFDNTDFEEGSL